LTATVKLAMEIWGDTNKLVFCSRGNVPTLFRRIVWRYQRGNQNPYIEEKQTTQWPKYTVQKDKQRSTKDTHKTKDRVTQIPKKTGGELMCPRRVGSYCSISATRRINLVTNLVINHEWEKDREVFTTINKTAQLSKNALPTMVHNKAFCIRT